jgi:hypothetical protein
MKLAEELSDEQSCDYKMNRVQLPHYSWAFQILDFMILTAHNLYKKNDSIVLLLASDIN